MVKITFKPMKEIIVHEAFEHKLDEFIKIRISGLKKEGTAQRLAWAEGVVFSRTSPPPTDEVVAQALEGVIHFSAIEYALLPKYRSNLKLRGVTIPIVNVSNNPNLSALAKSLKRRSKAK